MSYSVNTFYTCMRDSSLNICSINKQINAQFEMVVTAIIMTEPLIAGKDEDNVIY